MKPVPPFLIVADRTQLKSYFVDMANMAQPKVQLVEVTEFPVEYPAVEPKPAEGEESRGTLSRMAATISQWLQEQQPDHWGFAAPADLNEQVLNMLDETLRRALTVNVREDLTNVAVGKLPEHFEQREAIGVKAQLGPEPGDAI